MARMTAELELELERNSFYWGGWYAACGWKSMIESRLPVFQRYPFSPWILCGSYVNGRGAYSISYIFLLLFLILLIEFKLFN